MRILSVALILLFALSTTPLQARDAGATIIVQHATLADVLNGLGLRFHHVIQCDPALQTVQIQDLTIPAPTFTSALTFLENAYSLYVQRDGIGTNTVYIVLSSGSGHTLKLVHLFNADAAQVAANASAAAALSKVVLVAEPRSNGVLVIGPPEGVKQVVPMINALDLPTRAQATVNLPVYYRDPNDAANLLYQQYSQSHGPLAITGDQQTGTVHVTGSPGAIDEAKRILVEIDTPIPNVNISLRVVDITPRNDQTNLGVTLGGFSYGTGGSGAQVTPNQLFTTFVSSALQINATINTLIEHNEARVLQNPNVVVESGVSATLHIGDEIPIVVNNGGLIGGNQILTKDTGIDMTVLPVVNAGGRTRLKVTISYDEFAGLLNGQPVFHDRKDETVVDVRPNQTITFGGLAADQESKTETKIPILGDIPLFGRFFRNVQTSHEQEQIYFQLTPTIEEGS